MAVAILNTPVLTNFGSYRFTPMSVNEARRCVLTFETQSYVGHESTAYMLTILLGVDVPVNREEYKQGIDDMALVFDIESVGYSFGLLVRDA